MGYVRLVQERPAKWLLTDNRAKCSIFTRSETYKWPTIVRIRELQHKFLPTSTIRTNTEGYPASVAHEKKMMLNGRVISASTPVGIW